jgi:16S rRNA (guanine527-N7)-methyltransferase
LPALIEEHLVDSLALLPVVRPTGEGEEAGRLRLVDVGSGGGFPALPLAMVADHLDILCIESVAKKARAIEDLAHECALANVTVLDDRAERLAHDPRWRGQADRATARGVGALATSCELALPFLRVGGLFLAQKGPDPSDELDQARAAIALLGGRYASTREVPASGSRAKRTIVIVEKTAPTPDQYPRRPGLPAKRPLRGGR